MIVSPEDFLKNYGYNISDKRLKKIKNSAELQFIELDNIGDSVRARRIIDGTDAGRHMVLNTLERLNYL